MIEPSRRANKRKEEIKIQEEQFRAARAGDLPDNQFSLGGKRGMSSGGSGGRVVSWTLRFDEGVIFRQVFDL